MLDATSKAIASVAVAVAALGGAWTTGNPNCLWALVVLVPLYNA